MRARAASATAAAPAHRTLTADALASAVAAPSPGRGRGSAPARRQPAIWLADHQAQQRQVTVEPAADHGLGEPIALEVELDREPARVRDRTEHQLVRRDRRRHAAEVTDAKLAEPWRDPGWVMVHHDVEQ